MPSLDSLSMNLFDSPMKPIQQKQQGQEQEDTHRPDPNLPHRNQSKYFLRQCDEKLTTTQFNALEEDARKTMTWKQKSTNYDPFSASSSSTSNEIVVDSSNDVTQFTHHYDASLGVDMSDTTKYVHDDDAASSSNSCHVNATFIDKNQASHCSSSTEFAQRELSSLTFPREHESRSNSPFHPMEEEPQEQQKEGSSTYPSHQPPVTSMRLDDDLAFVDPNMEDVCKMIRELENHLDDLYDIQVKNAILMDDLVMAGADF